VEFSKAREAFEELGAVILGVSPDSPKTHKKFVEKHDIKITLLSDQEKEVLKKYGVWQLKKLYGREYYGVVRSTFLIDPEGKIVHVWKNVRVKGHVEKVLKKLQEVIKA